MDFMVITDEAEAIIAGYKNGVITYHQAVDQLVEVLETDEESATALLGDEFHMFVGA
jgi:hypothetical protein